MIRHSGSQPGLACTVRATGPVTDDQVKPEPEPEPQAQAGPASPAFRTSESPAEVGHCRAAGGGAGQLQVTRNLKLSHSVALCLRPVTQPGFKFGYVTNSARTIGEDLLRRFTRL